MAEKTYISIDLKSFFASVECAERGLDPLTTNLVVADKSRTEKTICLAVSPSLKAHKIPGRARLFEVVQRVKEVNKIRLNNAPCRCFEGKSYCDTELKQNPALELDYIIATPQMAKYMQYSTGIYKIYLKYVAPEDIHVYSIDEVFIDATSYLKLYNKNAREFAVMLISDVLNSTGITATAGIGTNLFLCKVAMDIEAKHIEPDEYGVRIAELDEMSFREKLWEHRPLTDFWRVGKGYAKKLEQMGMLTMGDIALQSVYNEEVLYRTFGINAELLIDHAWGYEPCTITDIKSYKPESNSISSGQVLQCPYTNQKAALVAREMADVLALDLVEKRLVTDRIVITVGYDTENLTNAEIRQKYKGQITTDWYGRSVPKKAHGSINLKRQTASTKLICEAVTELFDKITDKNLLVRRLYVVANHVVSEDDIKTDESCEQLNLFTDYKAELLKKQEEDIALEREKRRQQTIIKIKNKYGKNAILRGMNFDEGATGIERNKQVGGHKA